MAEIIKPPAGAGDPAAGGAGTTSASNAAGGQGTGDPATPANGDQPHYSHKEFVELARNHRALQQTVKDLQTKLDGKEQAKKEKGKDEGQGDDVAVLRRELAFRDALADLDVKITPAQRGKLQRLYAAEQPPDLESWLRETVETFGIGKAAAAAATTAQQQQQTKAATQTNTGAATRTQTGAQPDRLGDWDPKDWKALGKDGRREFFAKQRAASGRGRVFNRPLPK